MVKSPEFELGHHWACSGDCKAKLNPDLAVPWQGAVGGPPLSLCLSFLIWHMKSPDLWVPGESSRADWPSGWGPCMALTTPAFTYPQVPR